MRCKAPYRRTILPAAVAALAFAAPALTALSAPSAFDDEPARSAAALLRGLTTLPTDAHPTLAGAWPIAWPSIASGRGVEDLSPRDARIVRSTNDRLGASRRETDQIVTQILHSAAAPPDAAPGDPTRSVPNSAHPNAPQRIFPNAGLDTDALSRLLALDAACLLLAPEDESRDRARAVERLCALASLATLPSADPDDALPDQLVFLARTRATTASLALDCITALVLSPTAALLTGSELEQLHIALQRFNPNDPAGLLAACDRAMIEGQIAEPTRALLAPPGVDALGVARDATRVLRARIAAAFGAIAGLRTDPLP